MGGKAALLHVLGFGILLGYVSTNLLTIASRSQGNMSSYASATESHNIAVTGANVALARLYSDTSWRGTVTQTLTAPFNGMFTYTISSMPNGSPFLRSVSKTVGPEGFVRDTVEVRFNTNMLQSFSLFAWMTNFEGNVFWISGDTVWGRIHSNGNLHMSGTPVFVGKVTTAKGLDPKWGHGGNHAIFKEGCETGVAEIDFPHDLSLVFNAASSGGRPYAGNIEVRLFPGTAGNNDGYALVFSGGTQIDSVGMYDPAFNGVISSTGNISVKGTLDGMLSIASATNIVVLDDILYSDRSIATSDDVLGLIAEDNIIVANITPNLTDCRIDAAMFARDGSFRAEAHNTGSPRGTLHVFGSIVQDERGAVGTFNSGTNVLKTGYYKAYRYDQRLANPSFRPPYYPGFYTQTFAVASWWESVHIPRFY